jgi:hypothetical protein
MLVLISQVIATAVLALRTRLLHVPRCPIS